MIKVGLCTTVTDGHDPIRIPFSERTLSELNAADAV
jgi:hypothetical protein